MAGTLSGPAATAGRVDEATGARQEVEFFGPEERMFASLHLPPGPADAGLVVCPPVASEFEKNYRRETLLAWALAARGIAVGRFHYRGLGHSDGDAATISLESMVEDAAAATEHFRRRTGVRRLAFLGTRVGALVASAVARLHPDAPLALWEPVLSGSQYFREVFRASFMGELKVGAASPPSQEQAVARLRSEGWIDVLGYTVGWPLYESLQAASLEAELPEDRRPVLLVQLGRGQKVRTPYRALAERLQARGSEVETRVIDEVEAWWFGEERRGKAALLDATAGWVATRLGIGVPV
jgi:pimeloyl-ACP methyl ester carboxylesterase